MQPLQAAFRSQMEQQALAKNGATGLLIYLYILLKRSTDCAVFLTAASEQQMHATAQVNTNWIPVTEEILL